MTIGVGGARFGSDPLRSGVILVFVVVVVLAGASTSAFLLHQRPPAATLTVVAATAGHLRHGVASGSGRNQGSTAENGSGAGAHPSAEALASINTVYSTPLVRPAAGVIATLLTDEVTALELHATTGKSIVMKATLSGGMRAFFKPKQRSATQRVESEVAAYCVGAGLGLHAHLVPVAPRLLDKAAMRRLLLQSAGGTRPGYTAAEVDAVLADVVQSTAGLVPGVLTYAVGAQGSSDACTSALEPLWPLPDDYVARLEAPWPSRGCPAAGGAVTAAAASELGFSAMAAFDFLTGNGDRMSSTNVMELSRQGPACGRGNNQRCDRPWLEWPPAASAKSATVHGQPTCRARSLVFLDNDEAFRVFPRSTQSQAKMLYDTTLGRFATGKPGRGPVCCFDDDLLDRLAAVEASRQALGEAAGVSALVESWCPSVVSSTTRDGAAGLESGVRGNRHAQATPGVNALAWWGLDAKQVEGLDQRWRLLQDHLRTGCAVPAQAT